MEGRIVAGRLCKLLDSVFLISGPAAGGIGFEQIAQCRRYDRFRWMITTTKSSLKTASLGFSNEKDCSLVDRMARIVISNYQCHQGRQNLKDQSSRILQRILPEFHTQ